MPKIIKGHTARRPPEPADSHDVIDEWIAGQMPTVVPLVRGIDELICSLLPDPQFALKWAKAHYGLAELGWLVEVAAYHKSANVVFFAGADFAPPPPLGTVGTARYVKLHRLEDLRDPQLANWIEQAATVPGWR